MEPSRAQRPRHQSVIQPVSAEQRARMTSILLRECGDQDFRDINNICLKVKSKKDSDKSKKLRELGNKNFQKKINEEAIRYYNESILAGPIVGGRGLEVSLGLGEWLRLSIL